MSSYLSPAAFVVTWAVGAIHFSCLSGFFLLRHRAVFSIRVPEVVLACIFFKFLGFCLIAWQFLDAKCPCSVMVVLFWIDMIANFCNLSRKYVLLFRYKIQEALEKSKENGNGLVEQTIYIRWRHIIRPRWQLALVFSLVFVIGIGYIILLIAFVEEGKQPCVTDVWVENNILLGIVIVNWINFVPLILCGVWSTKKLKAFPKDSWKMGAESTLTSALAMVHGVAALVLLIAIPRFEGVLFMYLSCTFTLSFLNFVVPLYLHQQTVKQLALIDLNKLTSLSRLLKDSTFLIGFEEFLRTEFSSENLTFWQSIQELMSKYSCLLPSDVNQSSHISLSGEGSASATPSHSRQTNETFEWDKPQSAAIIEQAASECVHLGCQYVGDRAPWQINIPFETARRVETAVSQVSEVIMNHTNKDVAEGDIKAWLEEILLALLQAQTDVYEGLRKDSYPRFLLSPACKTLNNSADFKRLLASERLEAEAYSRLEKGHSRKKSQNSAGGSVGESSHKSGFSLSSYKSRSRHQTRTLNNIVPVPVIQMVRVEPAPSTSSESSAVVSDSDSDPQLSPSMSSGAVDFGHSIITND